MTGLWRDDMPRELLAAAPRIVLHAIVAYGEALRLPKTKAHAQFAKLVPDPEMAGLGVLARQLHEELSKAGDRLKPVWSSPLTLEELLLALAELAGLSDHLAAQTAAINGLVALPEPPRKLRSATAPNVYFSQAMKRFFERNFAQPHAKIVATLEQVAFDLPEAVDESTVLKR